MTEPDTTTATEPTWSVVRGTMQEPWSDYTGAHYASGGPLLVELAGRLGLGTADRVLVVGPHTPELIAAVAAATGSRPTVLVRGTADADALVAAHVPAAVVAGSLDGFAETSPEPFSVVVALDGLDRVASYDSRALSYEDVLHVLLGLATPDARLAIAHSYLTAPATILSAQTSTDRYGDNEFRPFHADPTRPATADALLALVERVAGDIPHDLVALFGPSRAPRLAVSGAPGALLDAPAGLTSSIVQAARAHREPLLATPDELIRTLSRAGRLNDAADGGIVLVRAEPSFDLGRVAADGTLVVAELDDRTGEFATVAAADGRSGWPDDAAVEVTESDCAQPSEIARYVHPQTAPTRDLHPSIEIDPSLVPPRFALTTTADDEFVRLAGLGDVPGFRDLARAVGAYVESVPVTERRVVTFDNLHVVGRGFTPGADGARWAQSVGVDSALAVAFWLLSDRFREGHLRQPWPDHVQGEALVAMWVEMAGHVVADSVVVDARQLADAVAATRSTPTGAVPDLRTALADAQQARKELADSQGQVFGLERTIGFRDKQLRTREQVIRNLRSNGGTAAGATQARTSTAVRIAKRTSQVRSVGELTAGVDRVMKRAKRNRAAKTQK